MALPSTITGVLPLSRAAGKSGPFHSSGGNTYGVFRDDSNVDEIVIYKSTNPDTTDFTQIAALTITGTNAEIFAYAATQSGDNIHIATTSLASGPSEPILYHVFDMSSDTFTTSNEDTGGTGVTPNDDNKQIDIAVRSGGPVICYNGPTVSVMGQKQRVNFARKDGAVWTADIALDDGGEVNYFAGGCVLGASDKIHFCYHDDTNTDALHKSLTSGNVLSAVETYSDSATDSDDFIISRPAFYDAAGTERITAVYKTATNLQASEIDNDGVPGAEEQVTDSDPSVEAPGQVQVSLAVKSDADMVLALYIRASDSDLYFDKNTNSGGWGTDVSEFVGTLTFISSNFFTRDSRPTLGYFINDGGTVKYNELVTRADLTGTALGASQADIVAGGNTIIITLTGATWVAAGATFDAQRQNIIDGLDSAQSELTGWNNEVRDKEVVTAVVRTSDTVVTITLTAAPAYEITASETITATIPGTAYENDPFDDGDITGVPTFQISAIPSPTQPDPKESIGGNGLGGISRNHTPPGVIVNYGS